MIAFSGGRQRNRMERKAPRLNLEIQGRSEEEVCLLPPSLPTKLHRSPVGGYKGPLEAAPFKTILFN